MKLQLNIMFKLCVCIYTRKSYMCLCIYKYTYSYCPIKLSYVVNTFILFY